MPRSGLASKRGLTLANAPGLIDSGYRGEITIAVVNLDRPVPFDPYKVNRDMGGFIVTDRLTNATVGAGLLHFALRRSHNWIQLAKFSMVGASGYVVNLAVFSALLLGADFDHRAARRRADSRGDRRPRLRDVRHARPRPRAAVRAGRRSAGRSR